MLRRSPNATALFLTANHWITSPMEKYFFQGKRATATLVLFPISRFARETCTIIDKHVRNYVITRDSNEIAIYGACVFLRIPLRRCIFVLTKCLCITESCTNVFFSFFFFIFPVLKSTLTSIWPQYLRIFEIRRRNAAPRSRTG